MHDFDEKGRENENPSMWKLAQNLQKQPMFLY